jgi:sulfur dioxygenase
MPLSASSSRPPHTPAPKDAWAPLHRGPTGIAEVLPEWVHDATSGAGIVLVDVRQPHEWDDELGHIPGARLVSLDRLQTFASDWDRNEAIVTVCRSGGRSMMAVSILEGLGFPRVASMRGGMLAWTHARFPVERT